MSRYVIRRDNGQLVAVSGSAHSYTRSLNDAAVFTSEEAARRYGVCSNESVVNLDRLLRLV